MPGSISLTIMSFITVIRRCAAMLNLRPIAILPPSLSDPDELLSVSPSSLTRPSSSTWWALGAARNYAGQQALIRSHLSGFKSQWKTHYTNRLMSNSNMATRSALQEDDIFLITDLGKCDHYPSRHPPPQLWPKLVEKFVWRFFGFYNIWQTMKHIF